MYTVEEVLKHGAYPDLKDWLLEHAPKINKIFGDTYNLHNFNLVAYIAEGGRMTLCRYKGELVGLMLMRLGGDMWDYKRKVLKQDLLYSTRPKATHKLLYEFIDFGKHHADDIITCISPYTNIKEKNLNSLGFELLEKLYVKRISK